MLVVPFLATAPAAAQMPRSTPDRGASVELSPYAGVLFSGDLVEGPLGTSVGPAPAPVFGAQLSLPVGHGVSLVANAAYAQSDLEAGVPIVGGVSFGESEIWLYDGGLEVTLPLRNAARLFLQGGVGGVHRKLTVRGIGTSSTDLAFNLGGGVDLAFSRSVGLRLMARDYVGRFDSQEAFLFDLGGAPMHNVALMAMLRISF